MLLPFLDPFTTREQGKRFEATFNAAYEAMGTSSDFKQLGSVLGEAYADMFFHPAPMGHAYVYHPRTSPGQKLPVVVFLHGWLGNMKAYTWSWARLAEQHGFVVICPTFGNGLWNGRNANETLRWLDTVIRTDPMCDPSHVFVVGLSNGGTGVTRWATVLPNTYRGLVYVSPVMDGADTPGFASAVGSRSILVVHGGEDNRIPPAYVRECVDRMTRAGLKVRSICYDNEDHVLVLSASDRLQSDLLEWIRESTSEETTPPNAVSMHGEQ